MTSEKEADAIAADPFTKAMQFARLLPDRGLTFDEVCSCAGVTPQVGRKLSRLFAGAMQPPARSSLQGPIQIASPVEVRLSRRDQDVIAELAPRLADLHQSKPLLLERALAEFSRHSWPSFDACIFRGFRFAAEARAYLRFLGRLGIPAPHLRIILFSKEGSRSGDKWCQSLRCDNASIVFRHPPNANSPAASMWAGIAPLFPQSSNSGVTRLRAADGFAVLCRFAQSVLQQLAEGTLKKTSVAAKEDRVLRESG